MSENIRVSEVSDILRKQLEGINANVQLDEIGTVLQVSDGVVPPSPETPDEIASANP